MHIDLDKVFNDYMATQQKSWSHDRSLTLGASEVFRCERWNWFDKIGRKQGVKVDEEPQRWGAMQRGNLLEDHFVAPALQGHLPEPLGLLFAGQSNQRSLVSGRNSATPDGLITGIPKGPVTITARNVTIEIPYVRSGCIGLEVKSIDPRARLDQEKVKHRGQSQVGLGLIRETTEWKPDHWLILYVDASFIDTITPFLIDFDPAVYEAAKAKAARVFEATDPTDLYPEGKLSGDCDHCPFKEACGEAVLSEYASAKKNADVPPEMFGDVEVLVRKYLELKSQFEPLEEEMKRVKQDVVEKLLEVQRSGIKTDSWRVTLAKMPGRKTVDMKALEASGIDLSQYMKQGQDFLQLTVKELD